MRFELQGVSCGYGGRPIIEAVSFAVESGQILCILGPNGVGKTTLFQTVLGFVPRVAGSVLCDGVDVDDWSRRTLARTIAYVPQAHVPPFPFSVRDVVTMGRTPYVARSARRGGRTARSPRNASPTWASATWPIVTTPN